MQKPSSEHTATGLKWEQYKDFIVHLYKEKELKNVILIMEVEHGFKASESQYKRNIAKWGLHKKYNSNNFKPESRLPKAKGRKERKQIEFVLYDQNTARHKASVRASVDEEVEVSPTHHQSAINIRTQSPSSFALYKTLHTPLTPSKTSIAYITSPTTLPPSSSNIITNTSSSTTQTLTHHLTHNFARLPSTPTDHRLLSAMISFSRSSHYDAFCTQCSIFGYDPAIGGCEIHRCLAHILAQYRIGRITAGNAKIMCRGTIAILLNATTAPLTSTVRIAVDIVWLWMDARETESIQELAALLQMPKALMDSAQLSYRALIAHCALFLARCGELKQAATTLKSLLGSDYEELHRISLCLRRQNTESSGLTFEQAIKELTGGCVRTSEDKSGWVLLDSEVGPDLLQARYQQTDGHLKREVLIVSGIALRALVEIKHQQCLRGISDDVG